MSLCAAPTEFAGELRRWRTTRRHSQLEVALRAGTTQRHISYLEQGRSKPGRDLVVRLAESLGLSLRERNALLLAAGYAPLFAESTLDAAPDLTDVALRPVRDALHTILCGHLPYPAVVVRPYGELVMANSAMSVLTAGADPALLRPPVNVLRLALHPAGMGHRVINLAEWGRHILHNLTSRSRPTDARLRPLVEELTGYLPALRPDAEYLGFAVPLRLRCAEGEVRLITTLTSFATAIDITLAELTLEAFLPADQASAAILRDRAALDIDSGRSEDLLVGNR